MIGHLFLVTWNDGEVFHVLIDCFSRQEAKIDLIRAVIGAGGPAGLSVCGTGQFVATYMGVREFDD